MSREVLEYGIEVLAEDVGAIVVRRTDAKLHRLTDAPSLAGPGPEIPELRWRALGLLGWRVVFP